MKIQIHDIHGREADWARDGVAYALGLLRDAVRVYQVSIEWANRDEDKVLITVTWAGSRVSKEDRDRLDSGFMERFNCYAEGHFDKSGNELS